MITFLAYGTTADEMERNASTEAARYFDGDRFAYEITADAQAMTQNGAVLMYEGSVRAWWVGS